MNDVMTPKRIYRSRDDRRLAGVAGGLAAYLAVDPVLVRVAFVVLAFIGGSGLLLYLVAWLIVPEEPTGYPIGTGDTPADERGAVPVGRHRRAEILAIVVLGVLTLIVLSIGAGRYGGIWFGGRLWPLALIFGGLAVLWLRSQDGVARGPGPSGPSPYAPPDASGPVPEAGGAVTAAAAERGAVPGAFGPALQARGSVRPSLLVRSMPVILQFAISAAVFVLALVVALGAVILLEGTTSANVTTIEALMVVLASGVGLAFAVARASGWTVLRVVAVTVPVCLVAAGASWLRPPLRGGVGSRTVYPVSASDLRTGYALSVGNLELHLDGTSLPRGTTHVRASVAIGRLVIVVPADASLRVHARVKAGSARALEGVDRSDGGVGVDRRLQVIGGPSTLDIDARVGIGAIIVRRPDGQRSIESALAAPARSTSYRAVASG